MPKNLDHTKPSYHFAIRDANGVYARKSESGGWFNTATKPCCWTSRKWAEAAMKEAETHSFFALPLEIVVFEMTIKEIAQEPAKTKKQKAVAQTNSRPSPNLYTERDVVDRIHRLGGLTYANWQCNPTRVQDMWNDQLKFCVPYDTARVKSGTASTARYFINGVDYEVQWLNDGRNGVPNAFGVIDKSGWKAKK